jgi:hypothetical protein
MSFFGDIFFFQVFKMFLKKNKKKIFKKKFSKKVFETKK